MIDCTDNARELPDRIYACLSNSSKTGITVLLGHANKPVSGWQPYVRADLAALKEQDDEWD